MSSRPTGFQSPNFKLKVNKWPTLSAQPIVKAFGDQAVRLIQERLRAGKQGTGAPLPKYSDVYSTELRRAGQGTRRDMELSGSLVRSIKRLRVQPFFRPTTAVVGWDSNSRSPNTVRTKGGTHVGRGSGQKHRAIVQRLARGHGTTQPRQVLGITQGDHKRLARWLKDRSKHLFKKK